MLALGVVSVGVAGGVRAQSQPPVRTVVVQVSGDVDASNTTLSRIIELLTPLGVFVNAGDGAEHAPEGVLARISVTRLDPQQLQIGITGAHGEQLTRLLPLPARRVDESAREAIATVCASNVQALLEAEPHAGGSAVADQPAPEPVSAQPSEPRAATQEAPATTASAPAEAKPKLPEASVPKPAPAAPRGHSLDSESPPRAPLPDPRAALGLGYELFDWGGGRLLHGPRLHASYVALPAKVVSFGLGAEAAFSWPSSASGRLFDVELSTWSLRVLAEPSLQLAKHWMLSLPLGAALQVVSAKSSGGGTGLALATAPTRLALALVLRPTVTLILSRRWSLALGGALELSPMQIRYGVRHPDGFTTVLASNYAKPYLSLDLVLHT